MTGTLRCLIVDDEAIARKRMHRLLSCIEGVEIIGERDSAEALLATLEEDDVDVILLDVQMSGMSGLDARALIPPDGPYVIFTTAHPEHAVRAFEVGAVDYVLKPIEDARLRIAIARAQQHYAARSPVSAHGAAKLPRLALETRHGIVLIAPADVSHAVLEGALVTVHTEDASGSRAYVTDMPLVEIEKRLGDVIERVHRRALVRFVHVARLMPKPSGGYDAYMKNGDVVEVSRQSARRIRKRLGLS